jgi:hypothetical protein
VVEYVDAKDPPGLHHRAREVDVLSAGLGISGRMVMRQYNRARASRNSGREDLTRLDRDMGDGSGRNYLHSEQAESDVQ